MCLQADSACFSRLTQHGTKHFYPRAYSEALFAELQRLFLRNGFVNNLSPLLQANITKHALAFLIPHFTFLILIWMKPPTLALTYEESSVHI